MHPRRVSALSSLWLSLVAALGLAAAAAAAPPFTATELMKLKRLADPQLSPDGTRSPTSSPRSTSRAGRATPSCGSRRSRVASRAG